MLWYTGFSCIHQWLLCSFHNTDITSDVNWKRCSDDMKSSILHSQRDNWLNLCPFVADTNFLGVAWGKVFSAEWATVVTPCEGGRNQKYLFLLLSVIAGLDVFVQHVWEHAAYLCQHNSESLTAWSCVDCRVLPFCTVCLHAVFSWLPQGFYFWCLFWWQGPTCTTLKNRKIFVSDIDDLNLSSSHHCILHWFTLLHMGCITCLMRNLFVDIMLLLAVSCYCH